MAPTFEAVQIAPSYTLRDDFLKPLFCKFKMKTLVNFLRKLIRSDRKSMAGKFDLPPQRSCPRYSNGQLLENAYQSTNMLQFKQPFGFDIYRSMVWLYCSL